MFTNSLLCAEWDSVLAGNFRSLDAFRAITRGTENIWWIIYNNSFMSEINSQTFPAGIQGKTWSLKVPRCWERGLSCSFRYCLISLDEQQCGIVLSLYWSRAAATQSRGKLRLPVPIAGMEIVERLLFWASSRHFFMISRSTCIQGVQASLWKQIIITMVTRLNFQFFCSWTSTLKQKRFEGVSQYNCCFCSFQVGHISTISISAYFKTMGPYSVLEFVRMDGPPLLMQEGK